MKNLIISLLCSQMIGQIAFAQDSSFGGETSATTDYSTPDTTDSTPSGTSSILGNDNTNEDRRVFGGGGSGGSESGSSLLSSAAGNLFDVVIRSSGDGHSSSSFYNFGAPLLTGKAWTGFLDLNGNGIPGELADGFLYGIYSNSFADHGTTAPARPLNAKAQQAQREMKDALPKQEMDLVGTTDSGQTKMEIQKVTQMFSGLTQVKPSANDQLVAFESLLNLTIHRPGVTASDGPVIGQLWNAYRENYQGLFRNLTLSRLANEAGLENIKSLKSQNYQLSVSRFVAILVMHEQAQRIGIPISDRANDALRAAFYGVSINMRKLNVSKEQRQRLINKFMSVMAFSDSDVVVKMARLIVSEKDLKSMNKGIYDIASVKSNSSVMNHWGIKTLVTVSAAATLLAAWLSYGHYAIDWMQLSIGKQWMISRGFGVLIVLADIILVPKLYTAWLRARSSKAAQKAALEGHGFTEVSPQIRQRLPLLDPSLVPPMELNMCAGLFI